MTTFAAVIRQSEPVITCAVEKLGRIIQHKREDQTPMSAISFEGEYFNYCPPRPRCICGAVGEALRCWQFLGLVDRSAEITVKSTSEKGA